MNFEAIHLDKGLKTPLYVQLKNILLNAILEKELVPGDLLPSEHSLSEMLGISKATVRQCMSELSNEGYIEKKRNRGTIVLDRKLNLGYSDTVSNYNERVKELGLSPKTRLLRLTVDDCSRKIAQMLDTEPGTRVIHLTRLRYADNMPIVYIDSYLLYEENRFILGHDFETESLYALLDQNPETRITRCQRTVFASEAPPEIAEAFNIRSGSAMLTVETIASDARGNIREYSISYSPNSRNQYSFTVTR